MKLLLVLLPEKPKKISRRLALLKGIPSMHELSVQLQSHDAALQYFKFKEGLSDLTVGTYKVHQYYHCTKGLCVHGYQSMYTGSVLGKVNVDLNNLTVFTAFNK